MVAMPLRTVLKGLKIKGSKGSRYLHGTSFSAWLHAQPDLEWLTAAVSLKPHTSTFVPNKHNAPSLAGRLGVDRIDPGEGGHQMCDQLEQLNTFAKAAGT